MLSRFPVFLLTGVSFVAFPHPEATPESPVTQMGVELLYRHPMSLLELPLEWFSYLEVEREGMAVQTGPHRWYLPAKVVAEDVFVMDPEAFWAAMTPLPPLPNGTLGAMPADDRLVLRWDPSSTMAEFTVAAYVAGNLQSTAGIVRARKPWPELVPGGRQPVGPPQEMRFMVRDSPRFQPRKLKSAVFLAKAENAGLGFGGIFHQGGGYLAAEGESITGPTSTVAWLYVGRDREGQILLWFQES